MLVLPLLLSTLLPLVCSVLKVQAPPELVQYFDSQYPSGQIPHSIANYG